MLVVVAAAVVGRGQAVSGLVWERAVGAAPWLRDGWDWVLARLPAGLLRAVGAGGATFFPVRSTRSW